MQSLHLVNSYRLPLGLLLKALPAALWQHFSLRPLFTVYAQHEYCCHGYRVTRQRTGLGALQVACNKRKRHYEAFTSPQSFTWCTFLQGVKGERGFSGPMGDKGDEVSKTNESRDHPGHMEVTLTLRRKRFQKNPECLPRLIVCQCWRSVSKEAIKDTSCALCPVPLHSE